MCIRDRAQVILLTIYPAETRGTAMGWYGLSIGAAPVIAPTQAGLIVDSIGWRAIFYLCLLYTSYGISARKSLKIRYLLQ